MRIKSTFLILTIFFSGLAACKSKKATTETASKEVKQTETAAADKATPKSKGKVSHQYRSTGCATVILSTVDGNDLTLIPSIRLPEKFDVDGLQISFDYRPLKMHNPEGCNAGFPAEISNISISK